MANFKLNGVTVATESGGAITLDSSVAGTGGLRSMQVFSTAGTFTGGSGWQKPSGITTIKVYVTGGGGGGGGIGGDQVDDHAEGGAAGGTAIEIIDVTSVVSVTVVVGSAGSGGAQDANGGDGTVSSFGSYCTATGGTGGKTTGASGYYATGGVGSGGNINLTGCPPTMGPEFNHFAGLSRSSSMGGASFWGGGGRGGMYGAGWSMPERPAGVGINGSGGGGGMISNVAGAAGGAGFVVVEEYS